MVNSITKGGDLMVLLNIIQLDRFNVYGLWVYVVTAILQLLSSHSQLHSKATLSLSIYLATISIAVIAVTVTQAIRQSNNGAFTLYAEFDFVYFFMAEIVGVFGLIYACLWCSTRYWVPGFSASNANDGNVSL
ncbi:hypothetical protein BDA99DRAFT_528407 [Phascolomyces articulosus]|uniref:Uncharacterized protein n=1 Tax=Phascolomyces articulosus TaxID=60185 RepID=A0AAD5JMP3_9FUNG|nr:hypothetical protein BDA99DRAFT_528407 [Phascolomyces articulosus]